MRHQEDIIALSTPPGAGAIAILRLTGATVIERVDAFCSAHLEGKKSHQLVYTDLMDPDGQKIDECVLALYRAPHSYTTENIVEINCHGSSYIVQRLMTLFLQSGVRMADPGEFTLRAYLHGRMDLAQAEAVADLIASESASQHGMAMQQLKGGFSDKINELRADLIHFASLLELENDFGEEDVEFADRNDLHKSLLAIQGYVQKLADSFALGNALKKGVPVALIGPPNAGKSTLLNALLQEDRAIVSPIPGTTRDVIEDRINIAGILYRFVDTAGLRDTDDSIEKMGITRSHQQISSAHILLHLLPIDMPMEEMQDQLDAVSVREDQTRIVLLNKLDTLTSCHGYDIEEALSTSRGRVPVLAISASEGVHLDKLIQLITGTVEKRRQSQSQTLITNARHHSALMTAAGHLDTVLTGLEEGLPTDLLALDLRYCLSALGDIIGEVHTDDLLENIFRNFCIGK